jgi:hypothetical protein
MSEAYKSAVVFRGKSYQQYHEVLSFHPHSQYWGGVLFITNAIASPDSLAARLELSCKQCSAKSSWVKKCSTREFLKNGL